MTTACRLPPSNCISIVAFWEGGASTFIHKGTNGRWVDVLSEDDSKAYEKMAEEKLGKECADWLKHGSAVPTLSQ